MNNQELARLLTKWHVEFHWDEPLSAWWLEGKTHIDKIWHSGYTIAASREEAETAALQWLIDHFENTLNIYDD